MKLVHKVDAVVLGVFLAIAWLFFWPTAEAVETDSEIKDRWLFSDERVFHCVVIMGKEECRELDLDAWREHLAKFYQKKSV